VLAFPSGVDPALAREGSTFANSLRTSEDPVKLQAALAVESPKAAPCDNIFVFRLPMVRSCPFEEHDAAAREMIPSKAMIETFRLTSKGIDKDPFSLDPLGNVHRTEVTPYHLPFPPTATTTRLGLRSNGWPPGPWWCRPPPTMRCAATSQSPIRAARHSKPKAARCSSSPTGFKSSSTNPRPPRQTPPPRVLPAVRLVRCRSPKYPQRSDQDFCTSPNPPEPPSGSFPS
jgi:hypothetical protein